MGEVGGMSGASGSLPPIKRRNLGAPVAGPHRPGHSRVSGPGAGGDGGWDDVGGPGGRSGRGRGSRGSGRGSAQTPPLLLIVGAALVVPVALWLGPVSRFTAVLVGMFVGVVLLGVIRITINARMQGGRYADWPVPATRVATTVFVFGWLAGFVSLWDLAIDFSRRFT
jgi:hypothetical protein